MQPHLIHFQPLRLLFDFQVKLTFVAVLEFVHFYHLFLGNWQIFATIVTSIAHLPLRLANSHRLHDITDAFF